MSLLSSTRLGMLYSKTSSLNNVCWKNWGVIKSIYCSLYVELCLTDPQVSNLTKVSVKRQAGRVRELWNRGILNLSALHQVRAKVFREVGSKEGYVGVLCLAEWEKDWGRVRNASHSRMIVTTQSQTERVGPFSQGGRRVDTRPP